MTGKGRNVHMPIRTCTEAACGLPAADLDESDPSLHGWIAVRMVGSSQPERLVCSPRCSQIAIARAQIHLTG